MSSKVIKVLGLVGTVSVILASVTAFNDPAKGYELDIYSSTPATFWIFFSTAMVAGIVIVLAQSGTRNWLLGLAIVLLARLSLLYMPVVRGYVTWQGDNITHWGYIKDILNSGHLYNGNFYPVTHALISQILLATNLPVDLAANLIPGFFSIIYVIGIYLMARALFQDKRYQVLATLVASVIFTSSSILLNPNGLSAFFIPFFLYLFSKRKRAYGFSVLILLVLVLYPFFHPLSSFLIACALVMLSLSFKMIHLLKNRAARPLVFSNDSFMVQALFELVILIPWIMSFSRFDANIRQVWQQITSGAPSVFSDIGDTLVKINLQGLDAAGLFIKMYGATVIPGALALLGIYLAMRKNKPGQQQTHIVNTGIIFLFFGVLYGLYLLGFPGLSSIGGERSLMYLLLLAPIFAAVSLNSLFLKIKNNYLSMAVLTLFLLFPLGLGVMNMFHSPYNINPNAQITRQNIAGMSWFIENKNPNIICLQTLSNPYRLSHGVIGYDKIAGRHDFSQTSYVDDHFSYNKDPVYGNNLGQDAYFVLNEIDRVTYSSVWNAVGRFNDQDFSMLEQDISVSRVYSNDEMEVNLVTGTGS